MGTYARALSPFVFDQPTTSKLGQISQKDHTSQNYQTSLMEWLDSLTYTPKYTNQFPNQQQVQLPSQQNKLQKQRIKSKINERTNQKESQLMQKMTMETKTNPSAQSNPSISLTETIDSERMTVGCSYGPLSTEKQIPRSISQKHPPTLHLTMQTDQMDSEETVAGRSYRQQQTKMDTKTIRQSITLAMNKITSMQIVIETEDNNNKTTKNPRMKTNMNKKQNLKIIEILNQPPLITTLLELGQVKGKVVVPKQRIQPTNDHDTRSKTSQLKSVPNKSLGSPEARATSDTPNHFTLLQKQRKKGG
ncbi:MAG: hypothetical protein EZS28_050344, partial [Streblomastix strix]